MSFVTQLSTEWWNVGWAENNMADRRISDFATFQCCCELSPFKIDCVTRYIIKCKPSGANFVRKRWGGPHSNAVLFLDANFHLHMFLKHMTLSLAHG